MPQNDLRHLFEQLAKQTAEPLAAPPKPRRDQSRSRPPRAAPPVPSNRALRPRRRT